MEGPVRLPLGGRSDGLIQKPQTGTPKELETLDLAITGELATADELGLKREGLQVTLRRLLFDVVSENGITDPATMRDQFLKSMNVDKKAKPRRIEVRSLLTGGRQIAPRQA